MNEDTAPETTTRDRAKTIAKFVVGRSVSAVIVNIIHQNVETVKTSQKVQLFIGAYVCGAMVADRSEDWTNHTVDLVADAVGELKALFNKNETAPTE